MVDPSARQVPARTRLRAIDAARGLALLGMIVVNVGPVDYDSMVHWLWFMPRGRASILFVLVAGVSVALFLNGRSRTEGRLVLAWRVAILFVGGLVLSALPHGVNVILPLYSALFLVAPVLIGRRSAILASLAAALAAIGPLIFVLESFHHGGDYRGELMWTGDALQLAHTLFLSRPYPFVVWLAPFVTGMILVRSDLRSPAIQNRLIVLGGTAAFASFLLAEVFGRALGPQPQGFEMLLTGAPHSQMPLWLLGSIASALFTIGLLLRYWEALDRILSPVAVLGRMPLTFYVAHLLILAVLRPRWDYGFTAGVLISVAMACLFLLAAVATDRVFGAGPFERLLRGQWIASLLRKKQTVKIPA